MEKLQREIAKPDFWKDKERAQKLLKEKKNLEKDLERWQEINETLDDIEVLIDLNKETEDQNLLEEAKEKLNAVQKKLSIIEFEKMMSGEQDRNNAIVTIQAGAGGTDAQDWAEILLRMYLRWAEDKEFKTKIMDIHPGEEAGIKSATFIVEGEYAYGLLKAEIGVHRLIRLSPFDTGHRRHTSFASVFVIPEVDDEIVIDINESDLRIDTYRSSGSGGQHLNKTDSAVRITHIPTGIVVHCQNERSQHKNKAMALKILRARLYEKEMEKKRKETEKLHKSKSKIDFGSQIRTYILHPNKIVKDHRTGIEVANADRVLDGYIDPFIESYLLGQ